MLRATLIDKRLLIILGFSLDVGCCLNPVVVVSTLSLLPSMLLSSVVFVVVEAVEIGVVRVT